MQGSGKLFNDIVNPVFSGKISHDGYIILDVMPTLQQSTMSMESMESMEACLLPPVQSLCVLDSPWYSDTLRHLLRSTTEVLVNR